MSTKSAPTTVAAGHRNVHTQNGDGGLDKRKLLLALQSLKHGDFNTRLNVEWQGLDGKIADAFNDVLDLNRRLSKELDKVNRVVGKEGKIGQRISLGQVEG